MIESSFQNFDFVESPDPVASTILALDQRLEVIRKDHLAKNRSLLRKLSLEQLQEVERLTSAITGNIFREVADELRHFADQGDGKCVCETITAMLELV